MHISIHPLIFNDQNLFHRSILLVVSLHDSTLSSGLCGCMHQLVCLCMNIEVCKYGDECVNAIMSVCMREVEVIILCESIDPWFVFCRLNRPPSLSGSACLF